MGTPFNDHAGRDLKHFAPLFLTGKNAPNMVNFNRGSPIVNRKNSGYGKMKLSDLQRVGFSKYMNLLDG